MTIKFGEIACFSLLIKMIEDISTCNLQRMQHFVAQVLQTSSSILNSKCPVATCIVGKKPRPLGNEA